MRAFPFFWKILIFKASSENCLTFWCAFEKKINLMMKDMKQTQLFEKSFDESFRKKNKLAINHAFQNDEIFIKRENNEIVTMKKHCQI